MIDDDSLMMFFGSVSSRQEFLKFSDVTVAVSEVWALRPEAQATHYIRSCLRSESITPREIKAT